jgi:hypothetical protein
MASCAWGRAYYASQIKCDISPGAMQHIYYSNLKVWEGDCGGDGGAEMLMSQEEWDPLATGPRVGGISEGSPLQVAPLTISALSSTTVCYKYSVTNPAKVRCNKWGLDVHLDPSKFEKMKQSTTATHDLRDDVKGESSIPLCSLLFVTLTHQTDSMFLGTDKA